MGGFWSNFQVPVLEQLRLALIIDFFKLHDLKIIYIWKLPDSPIEYREI